MYTRHRRMIILIIIVSFLAIFSCPENAPINYGDILTFSGITFGFFIATISSLYGSRSFLQKLHKREMMVREIQTTQLLVLREYFFYAVAISLSTAALSVAINLLLPLLGNFGESSLVLFWGHKILDSILISLLNIQLLFSFLLFRILLNGMVEETQ